MTLQAGPSAGQLDFTLQQGATWHIQLIYKAGADTASATPIDLTGYTARLHMRSTWYADTALLTLSDGVGITLGGSAGTIDLALSAEATAALVWRDAVYDLELEAPAGTVRRVIEGRVRVVPEVTR